MGIGVGAFKKINFGRELAVAQVKDALRSARLFALEQSATARVDVDDKSRRVVASGFVSTGNWHFEDERGWPTPADLDGDAEFAPGGAIGRCLALPPDVAAYASLGTSPSFDAADGLLVEAFVRVIEPGTVVAKGAAFRLAVGSELRPFATVRLTEIADAATGDDKLMLEGDEPIELDRWTRLAFSYDGIYLRLLVDGREVAARKSEARVAPRPDPEAPITAGARQNGVRGFVDEVRIASVLVDSPPPLPDGVAFRSGQSVFFDGRGRLDPARHREPVRITLTFDEGTRTRDVVVGLLGEIQ